MKIVLASGSPRRKELLELQGMRFEVRPSSIDESQLPGESALAYVERLALEKANHDPPSVPDQTDSLTIAADTIVELDGELLGKPENVTQAKTMLGHLAGTTHRVHTGVAVRCVRGGGLQERSAVASSKVRFHPMTGDEIDWYVGTGEPMDKAGAYGIQAYGSLFVAGIEGSYFNIVGLPMDLLYRLVEDLGVPWRSLLH